MASAERRLDSGRDGTSGPNSGKSWARGRVLELEVMQVPVVELSRCRSLSALLRFNAEQPNAERRNLQTSE
jgi:hypothetical protein